MILRLCAALLLMMTWSCSGDEPAAEEPVAPTEEAKVPDSPGDAGQTAEKPAGEGDATAEAPAPVEKSTSPEVKETGVGSEMTVTAGALNVRSGPGMSHGVVRVLKKGEKVNASDCGKGWCKIGEGEYAGAKYLQ
jgi:uncharacterized protein YgiM (DUF1202 family)